MTLEQQLAKLADLGLTLDAGITVEDLLYSFGRENYEERPFDLILFVLGTEVEREPWDRSVCSRVWNFDTECIASTGDYVGIVKRLCRVAGQPDCLKDVSDFVDIDAGKAWLKYKVGGSERAWPVEVNDDWADTLTLNYVMDDIQRDGCRFYFKDNGQAMVLFYLDPATAAELNRISNNALQPVRSTRFRKNKGTNSMTCNPRILRSPAAALSAATSSYTSNPPGRIRPLSVSPSA